MKMHLKKLLRLLLCLILAVMVVAAGYVDYLLIDYSRIGDMPLTVQSSNTEPLPVGEPLTAVTWNLGFGAYSADYSFFMDGGTQSRARSAEAVYENIGGAIDRLQSLNADLILLQEIDIDATRSHHIDQRQLILEAFPEESSTFAQNYDSAYLFYPLTEPHGASKAGQLTLVRAGIDSAERCSLPVETGLMKFFDLDRCYSVARIPVSNGRTLCLYNLHLSAYTSDGIIATEQLKLLLADMQSEYESGNYVIAGGDFNKDLLGNSAEVFGVSGDDYTWAQPLPTELIPEGLSLISSLDAHSPIPSCRNADKPYVPGESFVLTVDGFIVSDNITVDSSQVEDEGFAFSDHNPVTMLFSLAP